MAGDPRVERWDDNIAQQEAYKASGVDKHGGYHDYLATSKEDAVNGLQDEIDRANDDD